MLSKNQLKQVQSLQLKKFREQNSLFIAEGVKTVVEILAFNPSLVQTVYATSSFIQKNQDLLVSSTAIITEVNEDDLRKLSLQNSPNAVLAVCHFLPQNKEALFNAETDVTFYLDDIRDPGNLGTIIRLCDWFGMTNLFCSPNCCELYNPKVIQASMGAFLRVNVQYIELQQLLVKQPFKRVYGAQLNGKNIYHENLRGGLMILGNEANGINPENQKYISNPITIPAHPDSRGESLNAAMAASIIASEFFRRR